MTRDRVTSVVTPGRVAMMTAVLVLSLMTAVSAQAPVNLHMNVGIGSRTLEVTNLALEPLTDLTLIPGRPVAYRAAVNDLDYLIDERFTVTAENNHLYLVDPDTDEPVYNTFIESGEVSVAVGPDISILDEVLDLTPLFNVIGTGNILDCAADLGAVTGLLLVGTTALDVCTALDAVSVPIIGDVIEALDIDGLLADLLALAPGGGGPFTNPSYAAGTIGFDDPTPGPDIATTQVIMTGTPLLTLGTDLADAILTRLTAAAAVPLTDLPGVDPDAVIGALITSGQAELVALGDGIAALAPDTTAQEGVINAVLDLDVGPIDLSIIDNLSGVYSALPSVVANAPDGTLPGAYSGTHLITLMSE